MGEDCNGASGVALSPSDSDKPIPMTDEQIRQVTIGELKPFNGQINLAEYDPAWPQQFAREADRTRAALGSRAIQIEHIGSTSVPGLIAKPIIDILLVVADSSDEPSYVPGLEAAGYILRIRELDWHQHRLFKGPDTNINLHVFTVGSEEIDRVLALRDWLRQSPDDRRFYAEAKRQLARQNWRYVQNYADAKSSVVESIILRAGASKEKPKTATSTVNVQLRDVTEADLAIFFQHQLDPEATQMAAFPARDKDAFMAHWAEILGDNAISKRTILFDGHVAGNIVGFEHSGRPLVGYWLGREYWGKGVATKALSEFLGQVNARPLYAHVAKNNTASIRVLEKCGFTVSSHGKGPVGTRGEEVEEVIMELRT